MCVHIKRHHTGQLVWESVLGNVFLGFASCKIKLLLSTQVLQCLRKQITQHVMFVGELKQSVKDKRSCVAGRRKVQSVPYSP